MKIKKTNILGCFEIITDGVFDNRGSFSRIFCEKVLKKNNITFKIKQINFANTKNKGTFRGLHYQINPYSENKILKCIKGSIFDVVIDLRKKSKTYKKIFKTKLHSKENRLLLIPQGCAHGYLSLTDNTEIIYFVDNIYDGSSERGVRFNDPSIRIKWPVKVKNVSEKDLNWREL